MKLIMSGMVAAMLVTCAVASADSIAPSSFSATLDLGASTTITKVVTVDQGVPTTSKVDVYFLADSTGSMGGQIGAVKAAAGSILSSAAGLGNVAFAVGEYRDFGDAFVYRLNQDVTTSQAAAQAGINMWAAGGGGDFAEANLFALQSAANTTSWRASSERILVWFGDAPGHDPSGGATEASATAALVANSVQVEAIDVGALNSTGQAARIAAATGGTLHSGINTATIVATINAAITTAVSTYTSVSLDTSAAPVGVTVAFAPAGYVGAFDRSITRTFSFSVTYTGDAVGVYSFPIDGLVDGGAVARESDTITVRDVGFIIPEPMTMLAMGMGLFGLGGYIRRRRA